MNLQTSFDPRWATIQEQRTARVETATKAMIKRVASVETELAKILAAQETARLARHAAQMKRRRVRIGVAWFTVVMLVATVVVLWVLGWRGTG